MSQIILVTGEGRICKKLKEAKTKLNFYFVTKEERNILNLNSL